MILGLDISTSITGVSIVDRNDELIYCEAWRTDKKGLSHYEKLDIIRDKVCFLKSQYPIEQICVEEPLGMFAAGRSSAQVISKIQKQLAKDFSTPVNLHHSGKKGNIEIEFKGNEELYRILELLGVSLQKSNLLKD